MLESISYYIHSISRWLLRCRYSRGFGIQSPSAYSFVRYVVNEHDPYYAYEQLDEEMKDRSKTFRKLGRLFFRLANYWQPQYVVMGDYDFAPYVYAGCQNTLVRMIDDYYFDEESAKALVIVDMEWLSDEDIKNEIFHLDIQFRVTGFSTVFYDNMGNAVQMASQGGDPHQLRQREPYPSQA